MKLDDKVMDRMKLRPFVPSVQAGPAPGSTSPFASVFSTPAAGDRDKWRSIGRPWDIAKRSAFGLP